LAAIARQRVGGKQAAAAAISRAFRLACGIINRNGGWAASLKRGWRGKRVASA